MKENYNIFTNAPSLSSDETLECLRNQLSPKEYYYCALYLKTTLDAEKHKNFSVGSVKRYFIAQHCNVCVDTALFVVN